MSELTVTPDEQASADVPIADFETSLQKLKELVERLEGGELTLAESLQAFKEASTLADLCDQQLASVDQQVRIISQKLQ